MVRGESGEGSRLHLFHESTGVVSDGRLNPGCGSCEDTGEFCVRELWSAVSDSRVAAGKDRCDVVTRCSKRGLGLQRARNRSSLAPLTDSSSRSVGSARGKKVRSPDSDFTSTLSLHRHDEGWLGRVGFSSLRISLEVEIDRECSVTVSYFPTPDVGTGRMGMEGQLPHTFGRYTVFFVSLLFFIWEGHSYRTTDWKAVLVAAFRVMVFCDEAMLC